MPGEKEFKKARTEIVRGRTALLVQTRDEIVRLLKVALDQITVVLAGQPTDYQQWALPRLQVEIQQALSQFGEDAAAKLSTAAGSAWQLGQDLIDKPLAAGGVRISSSLQALDLRQLQAMRAFMTDRIKNVGLDAANKINAEMGLVVIGAQAPSDAISSVKQILGEQSRTRAATIVRTEVSRVYGVASFERLKQSAAKVPGLQKQWRKSGKVHPRPHHDVIDGQIRDVGVPFSVKPFGKPAVELMFPHDPRAPAAETINCGCIALPYKADWKMTFPKRAPGGLADGPTVNELLAQGAPAGPRLAEAFNRNQKREPKGIREGGRFATDDGSHFETLAEKAHADVRLKKTHTVREVSIGNAKAVDVVGLRIDGFRRIADDDHFRHVFIRHGNAVGEAAHNRRAVTAKDFARLDAITSRPESVTLSVKRWRGSPVIEYRKSFGHEEYVYAEAVHSDRHRVEFLSLRIELKDRST